jgi:hypothetical protein
MINQDQIDHALSILADREGAGSAARASHEYEREKLKVVKARLILQATETTQAAKEAFALRHPDYQAQLEHIRNIAEQDYHNRDRRQAAQAVIDIWRTESATNRTFGKAAQ